MKKFLSYNSWWFYFVLTFSISWSIWGLGNILLPDSLAAIPLIIGAFGPLVSATIIQRITTGRFGLKDWLKTTFNFRIHAVWYLSGGIFLPFLIAAVHHVIYLAFGGKSGMVFDTDWLTYFRTCFRQLYLQEVMKSLVGEDILHQ